MRARKTMERAVGKSGCRYRSHDYTGTVHWFAESDRSDEFDEASAKQALGRDLEFLRATLAGLRAACCSSPAKSVSSNFGFGDIAEC